jgi:hypothetical protein
VPELPWPSKLEFRRYARREWPHCCDKSAIAAIN